MAKSRKRLMCDFETTTDKNDLRVWAFCMVDIETGKTLYIGNTIEQFFDYLKDKNTVCYFHNLKFDGEWLLTYLLRNGYKFSDSREKKDKTFDALITDGGIFYSITVYFKVYGKNYKKVVFYDSYKKLPFKVSVIAKTYQLKDRKLSIDYDAYRAPDHVLTEEEKDYIIADCQIVAKALRIKFEQGLKKMTTASDALNGFKEVIGKKNFERWFPVLPLEMDKDIRRAYKGGFVYLNPKYKGIRGTKGITLDVNSLYPSVMYDRLLPYSYPMFFEGEYVHDELFPLYIIHLKCCFRLKPGHLPTLQLKNNYRFVETEYLTTSEVEIYPGVIEDDPVEMWLTSVDYKLLVDHYNLSEETYINGWKFRAATGMFTAYIDYWMHIKETTTGGKRQSAKDMMNSLYGKFATNPIAYKRVPYMDPDGVVRYEVINTEEKAKKHGVEPPEPREPVYTAMAAFITAYAREKTIRSAQAVYDRFIYADTDSLHLEGQDPPSDLEIHPTKLGAWKNEGTFTDSKYLRAKTYMETMLNNKPNTLQNYALALNEAEKIWTEEGQVKWTVTKVTCAGMPDNVKEEVTYDNFSPGSTFDGKLMPKRYPGGVVLTDTTFTIK